MRTLWRRPSDILVLTKANDIFTQNAFVNLLELMKPYNTKVWCEPHALIKHRGLSIFDSKAQKTKIPDLVVTLGGDGTLLRASRLFPRQAPPILSFSLGSLGFLIPFSKCINVDAQDMKRMIQSVFKGPLPIVNRVRLEAQFNDHEPVSIMNDIVVHRGHEAQLTVIDVAIQNTHITDVVVVTLI